MARNEEERVIAWRREELERAGYDRRSARRLAITLEVDLHLARDLLRRGCSQAMAVRILL